MEVVFLGDYIKQRRKELGLSQKELCEGICDPITISRMENGRQTPSHSNIVAILQRLGLPDDRYFTLLSKEEQEIAALQREITAASVQFQQGKEPERFEAHEAALAHLRKLEEIADPGDLLTRQYILSAKASLRSLEGSLSLEEEVSMLLETIRLTVPKFDLKNICAHFYTLEEIRIINQLGCAYSNSGNHKKAVGIFSQLFAYIQDHNQNLTQSGGGLPLVAHNYARELGFCKLYDEAIEIAEEGRRICVKYGFYQFLPGMVHIMAECYHFLGEDEKSEVLYHRAYHVYQILGNYRNCALLEAEAKEYLGIEFPDAKKEDPQGKASTEKAVREEL